MEGQDRLLPLTEPRQLWSGALAFRMRKTAPLHNCRGSDRAGRTQPSGHPFAF